MRTVREHKKHYSTYVEKKEPKEKSGDLEKILQHGIDSEVDII